jgi:hypothetical protein
MRARAIGICRRLKSEFKSESEVLYPLSYGALQAV